MKIKKSQHQLGRPEKEVLSNFASIKADWLVADAVDSIYALEDAE